MQNLLKTKYLYNIILFFLAFLFLFPPHYTLAQAPTTPLVTPSILFAKILGPAIPFDTIGNAIPMVTHNMKDVQLIVPVPGADLGDDTTKWKLRIRCGQNETDFPKYYSPNYSLPGPNKEQVVSYNHPEDKTPDYPDGKVGLLINLHNDSVLQVFGDCEFQTAGLGLTRPIDIEVYKDEQLYGASYYTVDALYGFKLANAVTDPSPITEKTTSADIIVSIPPNPRLTLKQNVTNPNDLLQWTTPADWELQTRCGVDLWVIGTRMPPRTTATKFIVTKKDGSADTENKIVFTISQKSDGVKDCQFASGDPIDIEIWRKGDLYGRSQYNVAYNNADTVLPPPCSKWVVGDPNSDSAKDITSQVEANKTHLDDWVKQNPQYAEYKCAAVETSIGSINTNPAGFIKSLYGIILSLAGGIALLLIILSGYQILTSEGNPEKIQGARETLTSAIIGLLFIIFSLVILQIIGYDILKIPGLKSS